MKRLLLAAVLLVLLAGGYYFRGLFFKTQDLTGSVFQYTLYSGNPDELYRFVPVVEAQMLRLPGLQDVNSDLQVEVSETIDLDRQKAEGCDRLRDDRTKFSACMERAKVMLPGITISFKLAPGVAIGQAIDEIKVMETRLALPATITASFSMRPGR
jgi:multidrug efflux pump subunit AcrB